MPNKIQAIAIDKLVAHPGNANRMSKGNFAKLVRNIERTGRYEPLVVRPKGDCFQIINGHHRWRALQQLGYRAAEVVVWDVDDHETNILLATLNRLGGSDVLEKKLALLKRLNKRTQARELAKLLPLRGPQIERLTNLKPPTAPARTKEGRFAHPLVLFLNDAQQQIVKNALSLATKSEGVVAAKAATTAAKKAAAITHMARHFMESGESEE
jgi:ParB-like chromosome segregation protein Spo0J